MSTLDDIVWADVEVSEDHDIRGSDPAAGAFHRLRLRETPERSWTLRAPMMSGSEETVLRAVFEACRGRAGVTTFTPPGESAVTVSFADDRLGIARTGADTYEAEIRIVEVL